MKKHNALKVTLIALVTIVLLTWLLPSGSIGQNGAYQTIKGGSQIGIFNLFEYQQILFQYFGYLILYILFVGGFYGVLRKIPAYTSLVKNIANEVENGKELKFICPLAVVVGLLYLPAAVTYLKWVYGILIFLAIVFVLVGASLLLKKLTDKKNIFLLLLMFLFASLVSLASLQIALFVFIPFIAAILYELGFDKMSVSLAVIGSILVGVMSSTYASGNISAIFEITNAKYNDLIAVKFIVLVVGISLLAFEIMRRNCSKKVQIVKFESKKDLEVEVPKVEKVVKSKSASTKKTTKSVKKTTKSKKTKGNNKADLMDEEFLMIKGQETKQSLIPMFVILGLMFIIVVLSFISWSTVLKINVFADAAKAIAEYKVLGFQLFTKLFGKIPEFGSWTLVTLMPLMFMVIALLSFIYNVKLSDVLDGFVDGVKEVIVPAMVGAIAYLIVIITSLHPFQVWIYNIILGTSKNFSIIKTALTTVVATVLNNDATYTFYTALQQIVVRVKDAKTYPFVGLITQLFYGLTSFISPTNFILMVLLSTFGIEYKDWFKNIWRFLLEILVVVLVLIIIVSFII